jgi:hypothetical protein
VIPASSSLYLSLSLFVNSFLSTFSFVLVSLSTFRSPPPFFFSCSYKLTSGFERITMMGLEFCFADNVTIIGHLPGPHLSAPCFFSSFPLPLPLDPQGKITEPSVMFFYFAR